MRSVLQLSSDWAVALTTCTAIFAQEPKPAAQQAETIRFCSYNVKNWLLMDRKYGERVEIASKPEKEKARVVDIIRSINPEILGLCEIGGESDLMDLKQRLKLAGVDYPHYEVANGGDETRRLGLLSKFPIVGRNSQRNLSYTIGETVFPMQRGILDATVEVNPELKIRAVGVHLKSMREIPDADQSLMRRNEAHLLRKHLDSILQADPKAKIVTYGDFNDRRHEPPIAAIMGDRAQPTTYMSEVTLRDINGEVWTHFWDMADEYGRLDYFFISPEMRRHASWRGSFIYSSRDFDDASDHRPIVLNIHLKPSVPKAEEAEAAPRTTESN
jgi:endonuclease/exonuclease/phosphatase family metal-dependent hydrolase